MKQTNSFLRDALALYGPTSLRGAALSLSPPSRVVWIFWISEIEWIIEVNNENKFQHSNFHVQWTLQEGQLHGLMINLSQTVAIYGYIWVMSDYMKIWNVERIGCIPCAMPAWPNLKFSSPSMNNGMGTCRFDPNLNSAKANWKNKKNSCIESSCAI